MSTSLQCGQLTCGSEELETRNRLIVYFLGWGEVVLGGFNGDYQNPFTFTFWIEYWVEWNYLNKNDYNRFFFTAVIFAYFVWVMAKFFLRTFFYGHQFFGGMGGSGVWTWLKFAKTVVKLITFVSLIRAHEIGVEKNLIYCRRSDCKNNARAKPYLFPSRHFSSFPSSQPKKETILLAHINDKFCQNQIIAGLEKPKISAQISHILFPSPPSPPTQTFIIAPVVFGKIRSNFQRLSIVFFVVWFSCLGLGMFHLFFIFPFLREFSAIFLLSNSWQYNCLSNPFVGLESFSSPRSKERVKFLANNFEFCNFQNWAESRFPKISLVPHNNLQFPGVSFLCKKPICKGAFTRVVR